MLSFLLTLILMSPPYQGVTPPNPRIPDELPPPGGSQCTMVWPGFQMLKTRARLFFLFTSDPAAIRVVTVAKPPNNGRPHVELRFRGCRAWDRNAWRPLITHYFPTNLDSVVFGDDPKTGELVIELYFKDGLPKVAPPARKTLRRYPLYELFFNKIK